MIEIWYTKQNKNIWQQFNIFRLFIFVYRFIYIHYLSPLTIENWNWNCFSFFLNFFFLGSFNANLIFSLYSLSTGGCSNWLLDSIRFDWIENGNAFARSWDISTLCHFDLLIPLGECKVHQLFVICELNWWCLHLLRIHLFSCTINFMLVHLIVFKWLHLLVLLFYVIIYSACSIRKYILKWCTKFMALFASKRGKNNWVRKKNTDNRQEIPTDKWCKHFDDDDDDDSIKFAMFWFNYNTIHFNWNISIHLLSMFSLSLSLPDSLCLSFSFFVSSSLSFINLQSSLDICLCWQCKIDFWSLFCIENGIYTACVCFSSENWTAMGPFK